MKAAKQIRDKMASMTDPKDIENAMNKYKRKFKRKYWHWILLAVVIGLGIYIAIKMNYGW